MNNPPEVWLRGPVEAVPALLQPVAHALLQAQEEVHTLMHDFPDDLIWQKTAGMASVGFHLQHLTGVLDRLFTYAKAEALSERQLEYLLAEGIQNETINLVSLLAAFDLQVQRAIEQLKTTDETTLTMPKAVGRKQLPSTTIGLLFHAAEHTMRHTGQLRVTAKYLLA